MKTKAAGLVLVFLMAVSASGQIVIPEKIFKKTKKSIKEYSTEKSEEEVNKEIEKAFGHIEKKYSKEVKKAKKDSDQETMNYNQILNEYINNGVSSEPVKYEDRYVFKSSVTMEFKTIDKTGKEESDGNMITFFNPDEKYTAYEFINTDPKDQNDGKAGIFILDYKNKATIILSADNENSGIAYGMDENFTDDKLSSVTENNSAENENLSDTENPLLKKTGRTKTIAGYKCEEYKYDDKNITSRLWITKDLHWSNRDMLQKAFSGSVYSHEVTDGFLMESETKDKSTGKKMIFRVTEVNKDKTITFNMADYNITNVGKMSLPEAPKE
jgi:hypothetical protein